MTRLTALREAILDAIYVLPLEGRADRRYAETRRTLVQADTPIGANDLWIAVHALALGRTLVTARERGVRRMPGPTVESWLTEEPLRAGSQVDPSE